MRLNRRSSGGHSPKTHSPCFGGRRPRIHRRLRNQAPRGRGPPGRVDNCTTSPAGPLPRMYTRKHCSTFLIDSQGCFATTPLRRTMLYRCGRATRVTRSDSQGVSPKGDKVVASPGRRELILAVVGYEPPPPQRRALLVGYSPNPPGPYGPSVRAAASHQRRDGRLVIPRRADIELILKCRSSCHALWSWLIHGQLEELNAIACDRGARGARRSWSILGFLDSPTETCCDSQVAVQREICRCPSSP